METRAQSGPRSARCGCGARDGLGGARWRSEQGVRGCESPFPPVRGLQLRPWPRSLGGTRRAVGAVLCGRGCFLRPGSGLATYPTKSPHAAPLPGPGSRRVRGGRSFRPALLPLTRCPPWPRPVHIQRLASLILVLV